MRATAYDVRYRLFRLRRLRASGGTPIDIAILFDCIASTSASARAASRT